jgi:hypothetical protein
VRGEVERREDKDYSIEHKRITKKQMEKKGKKKRRGGIESRRSEEKPRLQKQL